MIGILVGLAAEAAIARRLGCPVAVGGGGYAGALAAARSLAELGASGIVSFGLAGGLRPGLAAGAVLVPAWIARPDGSRTAADPVLAARLGTVGGAILAAEHVIGTRAAKADAWRATYADAADLETAAALASGLPVAALRAVCDPAERSLPLAALGALQADGRIGIGAVLWSVARTPSQIGALLALGREAAAARAALLARVRAIGSLN